MKNNLPKIELFHITEIQLFGFYRRCFLDEMDTIKFQVFKFLYFQPKNRAKDSEIVNLFSSLKHQTSKIHLIN